MILEIVINGRIFYLIRKIKKNFKKERENEKGFSNRNLKTSTFINYFIKPSLQAKTTYNEEFNRIYLINDELIIYFIANLPNLLCLRLTMTGKIKVVMTKKDSHCER